MEEEQDSSHFLFGLNFGAHFPNSNTAEIYTGSPAVTRFGIEYIFQLDFNRQIFDDYFQFPYEVAEYPIEPRYRTSSEIGFFLGYKVGPQRQNTIFLDFNISQVRFEQTFTVAIYDPLNSIPGPTFEQFPLFGRENRFQLNLGTQFSLYQDEQSNAYFAVFANLNNVQMRRNYFVLDNREYDIFHINVDRPNDRLGGVGYGAGTGLGYRFTLSEELLTDLYYNLYYSQTNFKADLQPLGFHHSIGLRFIWGKINPSDE